MSTKRGRPSVFTPELLESILTLISEGASERSIFSEDLYPDWTTWCKYKREHPEFINHYTQAKENCYKVWEARMLERAQDSSRDIIYDEIEVQSKNGSTKCKKVAKSDNTAVNRDRLIIDTMKWQMAKQMPKQYGEKVTQEISGPAGGPIPVVNIGAKSSTE